MAATRHSTSTIVRVPPVHGGRPAARPLIQAAARVPAVLLGDVGYGGETIESVYGPERIASLARMTELYPQIVTRANLQTCLPELKSVEALFSTWGMIPLTRQQLDQMPRLRAVFYAAGSVGYFAEPFLARGITVVSAWAANAVPVAEFTLGQILLANKGYFRNIKTYTKVEEYATAYRGPGNYDVTVSVLGAGQIGRKLIELLRPFRVKVLVFDPYLRAETAEALGVECVTLDEAFARGDVVSNHMADVPSTVGILNRRLFESLRPNATFINTGRGRTVRHDDLIDVLAQRTDLIALLDVTDPEPLPHDSPLRTLPNVHITSHIAGSIGREVVRNVDWIFDEFRAWQAGLPLRFAVTREMLATMA